MQEQITRPILGYAVVVTLVTSLSISMLNCGNQPKPPSIGVFLKNSGEDFVLLKAYDYGYGSRGLAWEQDLGFFETQQLDLDQQPLAASLPKIFFHGVDIDYSALFLGKATGRNRLGMVTAYFGSDQPLAVEKLDDDLYSIALDTANLYTGTWLVYYHPDAETYRAWFFNYKGPWVVDTTYPNGAREKYENDVHEGYWVRHGKYTSWYPSGQKKKEGHYTHDKWSGHWVKWYESGQKSEEGDYIEDYKAGVWRFWHENGQLHKEGSFVDDNDLEGPWTWWYTNGQKALQGQYDNNREVGTWISWDADGRKAGMKEYIDGQETGEGKWTTWNSTTGKKETEGEYVKGKRNGVWIRWHPNGVQKMYEANFVDGHCEGKWQTWHGNGQKYQEGTYRNGKRHGVWRLWDKEGNLTEEDMWENGEKIK